MEKRVSIARKVLAGTSALAVAIIGMTVSSPVAGASSTQDQGALDQVLASGPFEGAQSQSSPQAPPGAETQRIEFGDGVP